MLSRRFNAASPDARAALLEVMTRRYYRIRPLRDLSSRQVAEFSIVEANYDLDGRHIHVLATHVERTDLARCAEALAPLLADHDDDHEIVLDIYLGSSSPITDKAVLSTRDVRCVRPHAGRSPAAPDRRRGIGRYGTCTAPAAFATSRCGPAVTGTTGRRTERATCTR